MKQVLHKPLSRQEFKRIVYLNHYGMCEETLKKYLLAEELEKEKAEKV